MQLLLTDSHYKYAAWKVIETTASIAFSSAVLLGFVAQDKIFIFIFTFEIDKCIKIKTPLHNNSQPMSE